VFPITLEFSIAFSKPNIYLDATATPCGENNYDIQLWQCDHQVVAASHFTKVVDNTSPTPLDVVHPASSTCLQWRTATTFVQLNQCGKSTYMCTILSMNGSTIIAPDQDIFIEWYWKMSTTMGTAPVTPALITGKMTFVASKEYLLAQFNATAGGSYNGPNNNGAQGLPLLNFTNHTQQ
jgi:hypothetical protein